MTAAERPKLIPLRRPPVRQATVVRSDLAHTFDVFVRTIGVWWPVNPFSAGQGKVRDVTIEPRAGGRVYETWRDGTTVPWGELLAWDPPHGFTMTWTGTPAPTEVELCFTALSAASTRVAVMHRGWETLTDTQLAEDCAVPGGYTAGGYSQGWQTILHHFSAGLQARTGSAV